MIHIIRTITTRLMVDELLEDLAPIIKLAVDIHRNILAGSGQIYADCDAALIEDGSHQEDIWGANWIPSTQTIEYEALINIYPNQRNYSMTIQDPVLKRQVEKIARELLAGV